jgi:hypothetical protein
MTIIATVGVTLALMGLVQLTMPDGGPAGMAAIVLGVVLLIGLAIFYWGMTYA